TARARPARAPAPPRSRRPRTLPRQTAALTQPRRGTPAPESVRARGEPARAASHIDHRGARLERSEHEIAPACEVLRGRVGKLTPESFEVGHGSRNLSLRAQDPLYSGASALSGGHGGPYANREAGSRMKIAFDSRAKGDPRGIGRYVRCMLDALRETAAAGAVITETHRPRGADVFHSPWLDGAHLRCPCPMV